MIRQASSEVQRLRSEMQRAESEWKRAKSVYEGRAISKQEYEKSFFAYKSSIHAVERAQERLQELQSGTRNEDIEAQESRVASIDAQMNRLEVQFQKSLLKAPFDGICIKRTQDEGVTLSPGQVVLEINEANSLEARFSIPQPNLDLLTQAKYLEVGGDQHELTKPRAISQVDAMTRTVDIVIPIGTNDGERILPGQTCTLTLAKRIESDCVELPISALVASVRGLWSCYLLQRNDDSESIYTVKKVEVSVVHTDGVRAFVSSTLPDQALIIPDGVHKVVPGMQVRVIDGSP